MGCRVYALRKLSSYSCRCVLPRRKISKTSFEKNLERRFKQWRGSHPFNVPGDIFSKKKIIDVWRWKNLKLFQHDHFSRLAEKYKGSQLRLFELYAFESDAGDEAKSYKSHDCVEHEPKDKAQLTLDDYVLYTEKKERFEEWKKTADIAALRVKYCGSNSAMLAKIYSMKRKARLQALSKRDNFYFAKELGCLLGKLKSDDSGAYLSLVAALKNFSRLTTKKKKQLVKMIESRMPKDSQISESYKMANTGAFDFYYPLLEVFCNNIRR